MICGDFNMDLLKVHTQKKTCDFLDVLYGRGLYPLITKPSRGSTNSATLTDNSFAHSLDDGINSGLVISDVSDHLAVFATFNDQLQRKETEKRDIKG